MIVVREGRETRDDGTQYRVLTLAPELPTLLGMARPDTGYCVMEDGWRTQDGETPPHPRYGYRLPSTMRHSRYGLTDTVMWAPPVEGAPGGRLFGGDLLCTECYRALYQEHVGYDPWWDAYDLKAKRRNSGDKRRTR